MRLTTLRPVAGLSLLALAAMFVVVGAARGLASVYLLACVLAVLSVPLITRRRAVLGVMAVVVVVAAVAPLPLRPATPDPDPDWQRLNVPRVLDAVANTADSLLIDTGEGGIQVLSKTHRRLATIPVSPGDRHAFWRTVGGDVVVDDPDSTTVARYTATGAKRWRISETGDVVGATESITVLQQCARNQGCVLRGLNREGKQTWEHKVPAPGVRTRAATQEADGPLPQTLVRPTATGSTSADTTVELLDVGSGRLHRVDHPGKAITVGEYAIVAPSDAASPLEGRVGLVGYRHGKQIWSVPASRLPSPNDVPSLSGAGGSVVLDDTAAVDPATGRIRELSEADDRLDASNRVMVGSVRTFQGERAGKTLLGGVPAHGDAWTRDLDSLDHVVREAGGIAVVTTDSSHNPYVSERGRRLRLSVLDPRTGDVVFSTLMRDEPYQLFLPRPGVVIVAGARVRLLTYDPG